MISTTYSKSESRSVSSRCSIDLGISIEVKTAAVDVVISTLAAAVSPPPICAAKSSKISASSEAFSKCSRRSLTRDGCMSSCRMLIYERVCIQSDCSNECSKGVNRVD